MTKPSEKPADELARLRTIIKTAEWSGTAFAPGGGVLWMCGTCPWCGCRSTDKHKVSCDAFTPSGEVA